MCPSTVASITESETVELAGKTSKTIGYFAAIAAVGLTAASLGPTLPGLAEHTRTHLSEISFLFAARSLGYMLGSYLGGRFVDRLPGHPLMVGGLFAMAAMMALVPLMPLLWLLTAVQFVLGMVESTVDVASNTLLVWVHGHQVGPFVNALHFFFGVGAFISPIIIAQAVLISGDITWAYWALALLVLPVVGLLLRLPSPKIQGHSRIDEHSAQGDSETASALATRRAGLTYEYVLTILIVLFFFLCVGAEVSFGGWIFTYAMALGLAGETTAAYLTSAFWGSFTIGRLLGIPIAARFRPRHILMSDLLGCMVSLGIILLWPDSGVAIWLGALGFGLSMASIVPVTISLAERRIPITGKVTGWFFLGGSAGSMSFAWLIGQLFESIGPSVVMVILQVDIMMALAVFAVLILYSARSSTT